MSICDIGVPSLKRSEVEAACEDFSNIIGSLADGTVYKGTLSSGVEIAVASTAVTSSKNWSKDMEDRFRKEVCTMQATRFSQCTAVIMLGIAIILFFLMIPDRDIIKSESQELFESHWLLRRAEAIHKNDGF